MVVLAWIGASIGCQRMATEPVCERMHPPILRSCPYDTPPAECPWPWGPQQMHQTTLNSAGGCGDGESQGFRSVFGAKKTWEASAQDDAVPHNPHDGLIWEITGQQLHGGCMMWTYYIQVCLLLDLGLIARVQSHEHVRVHSIETAGQSCQRALKKKLWYQDSWISMADFQSFFGIIWQCVKTQGTPSVHINIAGIHGCSFP